MEKSSPVIELVRVGSPQAWTAFHAIRRKILWDNRGRTGYDNKHPQDYDPQNHALMLTVDDVPTGVLRLDRLRADAGIVRLVAIREEVQGQGYGRVMAQLTETYALQLGYQTLYVNAAPDAIGYYEKTGWVRFDWDPSELTGIAAHCLQMRRSLSAASPA